MVQQMRRSARGVPRHANPTLLAPNPVRFTAGILAVAASVALWAAIAVDPAGAAARDVARPVAHGSVRPALDVPIGAATTASVIAVSPSGPAAEPHPKKRSGDLAPASALAASGIPSTALIAYRNAAARVAQTMPGCGLGWPLLAAIGRVESDHGRFAGAVLHSDGLSTPPVIGIALDGHGTALIRDTDGGRLDGDTVYDRAVGPMQFIPSTWAGWGVDMNADGRADPFNIFDAAGAAADYLRARS